MAQARKKRKKRAAAASSPEASLEGVGPGPFARAKRWASWAAISLLLGIAVTATNGALLGPLRSLFEPLIPWLAASAMAAGIAAAHHVGRCGPDPGQDFSDDARADR